MSDLPLSGRLALDLTQGIAGPYAGRLLAEHGCRVIKVEPPEGDWIRQIGSGPGGISVNFLYYNLGKESVTLDLKTPAGVAAALAIAERADVVLESARPGVMERLGLGFEAVRARNPRVVYLSVSGFGLIGPRAPDPMTDTVAQAWSGMMSINRGADGVPHKIQTTIVDAITGLYAFQAVGMALMAGGPGGAKARRLDVSLMQSAAAIMGPKVMEFAHHGHTPATPNAPAGSYRTADGWIAVTLVRESHFVAMAAAIGRPELSDDPRFATFAARLDNLDALVVILSEVLAARTTAEWLSVFAEKGVLASPINDFGDWLTEPHVVESGAAPVTAVGPGAEAPTPRTPGRPPFVAPAPAAGADTGRVLSEFAVKA
jgi:crotonobetainyl-CoA:carnitine CoA-transferase CaiB-like acyl-CoA transferase